MALALVAGLVVAVPLLRGGVSFAVQALAVVVAGSAALLALWWSREVPWPALGLVGVVLIIGVQLLPVPTSVHALSPATEQTFRLSLGPLGRYPTWRPLTLDIPATARELGKSAACLAAFVTAWSYAETRRRRSRLFQALAAGAGLVAVAVLGAGILGLQPFLAPRFPFVNPNHLAAFLDLTAFVALGLASRSQGHARLLWGLVFAAASAVLFASLSRGGIGAYFVGLAIFGVLYLGRRRDAPGHRRLAVLAALVAVGLGTSAYLALGPVELELETLRSPSQEAKIAQWPAGMRMLKDFPVLGIGRGAFASTFPAYKTDPTVLTFTHLENEWLQPLIDLGIPGGLLLLSVVGSLWCRAAVRRELSAAEMGLIAGAGALFAHELFDFSLEVLGVALPLSVALGLLARGSRVIRVIPAVPRVVLAAVTIAGLAGIGFAFRHRAEPGAAIAATPPDAAIALATDAIALRPADYLPHAAAGARLAAAGRCGEAIPWLSRATAFAPGIPEPHLYAARCLVQAAPSMSRSEYRLAWLLGQPEVLSEAVERWTSIDDLYELVPDTGDGLLALGSQLASRRPEQARQVYQRALDEFGDARARLPLGRVELALGDREAALALALREVKELPQGDEGYRLAAEALLALDRPEEARSEIEHGLQASPGSPQLLAMLCARLVAERRYSEARRVAENIPGRSAAEVSLREQLVAGALAAQGRLSEAIYHAESAAAAQPNDPGPLLRVAQLASEAGRYADAIAALERAAALPGSSPDAYAGALAEARAKLAAHEERQRDAVLLPGAPSLPEDP